MTALFIVLEEPIPDLDIEAEGRMLSQFAEKLENACLSSGITPLFEFFSQDPEELGDFMAAEAELQGEEEELEEFEIPEEEWFEPAEGLKTLAFLKEHLTQNPDYLTNSHETLAEITAWQAILEAAQRHNIKWHLEVDI